MRAFWWITGTLGGIAPALRGGAIIVLCGCATGPHPAMELAARDFDCPMKSLTRHEIYPNKQRVEGCGKEAVYVKDCSGYGTDSSCQWAKAKSLP